MDTVLSALIFVCAVHLFPTVHADSETVFFLALLDIHTEVMTFGHSDGKLMLISNQVNGSALLVLSGFFATDSL